MHSFLSKFYIFIPVILLLVVSGGFIYFKYIAHVPDKGGMISTDYISLEVTPYNSGTDEFGNSVGYGKGQTARFEVKNGDVFYEAFGDTLLQNPSAADTEDTVGIIFEIKSINDDSVTIVTNGNEMIFKYNEGQHIMSQLLLMDGASTSYSLTFTK